MPFDAIVTAEQAESALGHNQATEFDDDLLELMDLDQRAEEEELIGKQVNPVGIDYSCICWSPDVDATAAASDSVSARDVAWHPPWMLRRLRRQDFSCNAEGTQTELRSSVEQLFTEFEAKVLTAASREAIKEKLHTLDPTQTEAYLAVTEWAEREREREESGGERQRAATL